MEELPHAGLYRRATAAALLAAPALLLADNLIHPEEFKRGNEPEQLAEIGANYTAWQAAHALGFVAIVIFAAVVLGLAFLVRRRQPLLGLVAGALALAGVIGLASVITIDGFMWGILGEVSTRGPAATGATEALTDAQHSEWSYLYYLTPLGFIVGFLALTIGAARQGALPAWVAGVLALATLMVGTETAIPSNAYFIAGAAVLLVGGAAAAAVLWRMSDAEFARGGP